MRKTTKVLFIWHDKGYSTFQSMRCRLILGYAFKFRIIVLMLSILFLLIYCYHLLICTWPGSTSLVELLSYYTTSDCILQTSDYSTIQISHLHSALSEFFPLLTIQKQLKVNNNQQLSTMKSQPKVTANHYQTL